MAAVAGLGTTFGLPNYVGELFFTTPAETPVTSMIGGLTGGVRESTLDFEWQFADNADVTQPAIVQGADATFSSRSRTAASNVVQIHQEGFHLAYTKLAAVGNVSGLSILGNQPVTDERAFQTRLKVEKIARDVEHSFINGTYQKPTDNNTGRKTRGLLAAVTTNAVAASAAELTTTHFNTLFRQMYGNTTAGAPFRMVVIICNAYQKQRISQLYGYAPQSRNVGGLAINQLEMDLVGHVGIVLDRYMPTDEILVLDLSVVAPHILEIPGYGFLFMEPLAKTGAAEKHQIYGEIGISYGVESWHGKITGLADGT